MSHDDSSPALPNWAVNVLLLIVAAVGLFIIWSLANQNKILKATLESSTAGAAVSWEVGDELPNVDLESTSGTFTSLGDATRDGAVVAFLTTRCRYCQQSLPVWTEVHRELSATGTRFLAISLDSNEETKSYIAAEEIDWPIHVLRSTEDLGKLRIRGVPLTLVVSGGAEVTAAWPGALSDRAAVDIVEAARVNSVPDVSGPRQ